MKSAAKNSVASAVVAHAASLSVVISHLTKIAAEGFEMEADPMNEYMGFTPYVWNGLRRRAVAVLERDGWTLPALEAALARRLSPTVCRRTGIYDTLNILFDDDSPAAFDRFAH